MKIYRVIPNSFCTKSRLNSKQLTGVEDIYYKMGYTSFLGQRGYHQFNNLSQNITEEGKYFYLFPEDAILEGHHLVGSYHRLNVDSFLVIEYDVPEDIILKNIGYGDYTTDIMPWLILETYIAKSDLGGNLITTSEIQVEDKNKYLVEFLNETLKKIKEFKLSAWNDMDYYIDLFKTYDLSSIIDNREKIKDVILHSQFYQTFLSEFGELVKSPYITGKIISVNTSYISSKFQDWENATEYFKTMGIRYSISKEQDDFKEELLHCVGKKRDCKDIEKVKSLLKERKYI